ncbi:hypothetical protein PCK1_000758 [Pneumocystis canis]|nr:hypothetical protein PCK1_000758 [Pneumocystis canis]
MEFLIWENIDLKSIQKQFNEKRHEIIEKDKRSKIERKELLNEVKGKLYQIKQILKLYQSRVDNLTERVKDSKIAFFSIYKHFAEAPDPFPLLGK